VGEESDDKGADEKSTPGKKTEGKPEPVTGCRGITMFLYAFRKSAENRTNDTVTAAIIVSARVAVKSFYGTLPIKRSA
jgi:hypothetical protein